VFPVVHFVVKAYSFIVDLFVMFLAVVDDIADVFEPVFDSGLDELEVVV